MLCTFCRLRPSIFSRFGPQICKQTLGNLHKRNRHVDPENVVKISARKMYTFPDFAKFAKTCTILQNLLLNTGRPSTNNGGSRRYVAAIHSPHCDETRELGSPPRMKTLLTCCLQISYTPAMTARFFARETSVACRAVDRTIQK